MNYSAVKSKNKMLVAFCVKGFGNQQEIIQVLCIENCRQDYPSIAQLRPV